MCRHYTLYTEEMELGDSSVLTVRLQLPKQNQTLPIWCIRIWKFYPDAMGVTTNTETASSSENTVPATVNTSGDEMFSASVGDTTFLSETSTMRKSLSLESGLMETFGRFHLASSERIRWKTILESRWATVRLHLISIREKQRGML